jgi:hypothetical protein
MYFFFTSVFPYHFSSLFLYLIICISIFRNFLYSSILGPPNTYFCVDIPKVLLRHHATRLKAAGSFPDEVIGIFS